MEGDLSDQICLEMTLKAFLPAEVLLVKPKTLYIVWLPICVYLYLFHMYFYGFSIDEFVPI